MPPPEQTGGASQPRQAAGNPPPQPTRLPTPDQLERIIVEGDIETLITISQEIGRGLARNERLTTTQVRGFFSTVRQIQVQVSLQAAGARQAGSAGVEAGDSPPLDPQSHRRLVMLRPKLAYQAQRDSENRRGRGVERLQRVLDPAIALVGQDGARFQRFVEFFEAILAYHKAAGGKEQ